MQTIEYRGVIDKSSWGAGPWQDEPDKKQWLDPVTGLACLIVRHEMFGSLSGYVGVPPTHPAYGLHYDGITTEEADAVSDEYRRNIREWSAAGCPSLSIWWKEHPTVVRPKPVPGIGERLQAILVHWGLSYARADEPLTPGLWAQWCEVLNRRRPEAMAYPLGDAARDLKVWGEALKNYDTWRERVEATRIGAVLDAGEPPFWWFGFDCLHAFDLAPGMQAIMREIMPVERERSTDRDIYRDWAYVESEIEAIANQLADLTVTAVTT